MVLKDFLGWNCFKDQDNKPNRIRLNAILIFCGKKNIPTKDIVYAFFDCFKDYSSSANNFIKSMGTIHFTLNTQGCKHLKNFLKWLDPDNLKLNDSFYKTFVDLYQYNDLPNYEELTAIEGNILDHLKYSKIENIEEYKKEIKIITLSIYKIFQLSTRLQVNKLLKYIFKVSESNSIDKIISLLNTFKNNGEESIIMTFELLKNKNITTIVDCNSWTQRIITAYFQKPSTSLITIVLSEEIDTEDIKMYIAINIKLVTPLNKREWYEYKKNYLQLSKLKLQLHRADITDYLIMIYNLPQRDIAKYINFDNLLAILEIVESINNLTKLKQLLNNNLQQYLDEFINYKKNNINIITILAVFYVSLKLKKQPLSFNFLNINELTFREYNQNSTFN